MAPRFTTYDRIMRKLKGRLHLGTSPHVGGTVVTEEEIDDIALEQEGYMEAILGMLYQTPLVGIDPLIGRISTNLIASELLSLNFQGTGYASESTDLSNLMVNYRKDAESILMLLTAGHNIVIPGMPPPPQGYGVTPQPVVLKGETQLTEMPDTITRNVTVMGAMSRADGSSDPFGFFGLAESLNPNHSRARDACPLINPNPEVDP